MPTTSLIAETPVLSWAAGQLTEVTVTPTIPSGRDIDGYGTWTLTVREDPEFPRTGAAKAGAASADPIADGWEIAASAEGTVGATTVVFTVTVPEDAGFRRYTVDVTAEDGDYGRVQIFPVTWLTVGPTLKALS